MTTTDQEWTIGRLLDWTAQFLADKGCEAPRLDAEVLLAAALDCQRIELYTRFEDIADDASRERFRGLVKRRVEGCPVAYLVGQKEFFALKLEVSPAVLIPRPESEFVVMECLRLARELPRPRILDLGTGSGNLPIAIAHKHKTARLTTIDQSAAAIAVARRNADKHGVGERVRFLHGDLFEPLEAGERFSVIVSNPPYIPSGDIDKLEPGVRDYEPHAALDGGPDGFAVFQRILDGALNRLEPAGHLIVEIGSPQEEEARSRIAKIAGFELSPTVFDYSRHPRVLCARLR